MKRSIESLVTKTMYSPSGALQGGFGSIRGGMAANDFGTTNIGTCTNTDDCGSTTNIGTCFNRNICQVTGNQTCTNSTGVCTGSTNQSCNM